MSDQQQQDQQDPRDADQQDQHHDDALADDLGDKGKAALKAERDARRAAEKAARDAQDKLDAIAAARQKADEAAAAEQGRWQELAEKREADLATAMTDLTTTRERLATLEQLAQDRLDALLTDIPEAIAALAPDADTPIEKRLEWAEKAAKAAGVTTTERPGNGPGPRPGTDRFDADKAAAGMRQSGRYTA